MNKTQKKKKKTWMEQQRKGKSATPRGIKTSLLFQMLHTPSFTTEDAVLT